MLALITNNYDFLKLIITRVEETCSYKNLYFDYLHGRPIKTNLSKDEIHLENYKRDNAHVDIEKIINDLKESKNHDLFEEEKNSVSHRPSKEQDYLPFFTVKIGELISKNRHAYDQDLKLTFLKSGLVEKCTDATYNDRTSKALLMNYDLYPWKWKENSEQAVKSLCSLVKHSALEYILSANLAKLHHEINPNLPEGMPNLGSMLAEVDIASKCHNSKYNADYSKAKLVSYDLYPWGLEENSEREIEALCKIVGELPYMQSFLAESLAMSKGEF